MRLLSDFDGVWTYPDLEGEAQRVALEAAFLALVPATEHDLVRAWIEEARATVMREPHRYGWYVNGRVSAFADEDPFAIHSAVLHRLGVARETDALAARLADAIEASGRTLEQFGGESHFAGVKHVEATRGPAITDAAADAGRRMLAGGVDIVVVSNSGTEKLQRWFGHAEVPARVHPEGGPGELRLRGAARKFVLADAGRHALHVGALDIDVARPHYESVLLEEAPDAVVGDVFSIDLALPLHLKRTRPEWRHVRLFWLVHPYTTERMKRQIATLAPGEVESVEGGLVGVAERLLAQA